MSDPKAVLESFLDDLTATIDDGATAATILVHYAGGNDTFKELFITDDYDVVVEIDEGRYGATRPIQDVPVHHQHYYMVRMCTLDKYNSSDVLIATGSEMQWKMRSALQTKVEAQAQGSQYTLTLSNGRSSHRRVSGYYLYVYEYDVLYEDSQ